MARIAVADSSRGSIADSIARVRQDSINRAQPGYVVDSVLPVEEEIRRFHNTLGRRTIGLSGGTTTRDALVRTLIGALERNDEQALRRLVVDRAEFGFLVYPTSPHTRPPYRLSPDIVWLQRSAGTEKALTRLLQRFGGRPSGFAGYACEEAPAHQGSNRIWGPCVVRLRNHTGDSAPLQLFGPIIERDGMYKFLSLANGL
jgi:hypothetical protein